MTLINFDEIKKLYEKHGNIIIIISDHENKRTQIIADKVTGHDMLRGVQTLAEHVQPMINSAMEVVSERINVH